MYGPDASYLGEIIDLRLAIGITEPSLVVRRAQDSLAFEIPWDKVGFIKDIILTKEIILPSACKQVQVEVGAIGGSEIQYNAVASSTPTTTTTATSLEPRNSPGSTQPVSNVPVGVQPPSQTSEGSTPQRESESVPKFCTNCGRRATWIKEYSRYYCYRCKKYA